MSSIFFGGGTPSLLLPSELEKVFSALQNKFSFEKEVEVTLEINPETVTTDRARDWQTIGINRASLGVQSLDDAELKILGRTHSANDSEKAFEQLRKGGFSNISLDLIFGSPETTLRSWEQTLLRSLSWEPEHLSTYALTVEEKTPFATLQKRGVIKLPSDEIFADFFFLTREKLSGRGLFPYELSNSSRPGFQSRHNLNYWHGGNYWGIGASAHSFQRNNNRIKRFWNPRDLSKYRNSLEEKELAANQYEILSPQTHWRERIMTGLRLEEGIHLDKLTQDLDISPSPTFLRQVERWKATGHLIRQRNHLKLTPQGLLVSDQIFTDLL